MSVSTRTPEGLPHRCPVCSKTAALTPSSPNGDSVCPSCGSLLWWFRDYVGRTTGIDAASISLGTHLGTLGLDSLDVVEIIMEMEENFDLSVPGPPPEGVETIEDLLRWVNRLGDEEEIL